jgi:hypothetical protein
VVEACVVCEGDSGLDRCETNTRFCLVLYGSAVLLEKTTLVVRKGQQFFHDVCEFMRQDLGANLKVADPGSR